MFVIFPKFDYNIFSTCKYFVISIFSILSPCVLSNAIIRDRHQIPIETYHNASDMLSVYTAVYIPNNIKIIVNIPGGIIDFIAFNSSFNL